MATKTAIVTGALVPGYGRAITEKLLTNGFDVYGTYQSYDRSLALEIGTSHRHLKMLEVNLESRDELARFTRGFLDVDINLLVNAQFFWELEDPDNFSHELWDRSIAINLTAVNYLIHELKSRLTDGGNVILITSTEGLTGSFGSSAYAAARAAEHNLTKTFANNLGKRNIRVNAVAAGWIEGVMDTDDVFNQSCQMTPLGRLGSAQEVANVVLFLASESASFINGQTIVVDGGYTCVDYMAKYEFEYSRT